MWMQDKDYIRNLYPSYPFSSVVVGLQDEVCFQKDILHWVSVEEMKARLPRLRASEEPQALKDLEQGIWVWGCPNKRNKEHVVEGLPPLKA